MKRFLFALAASVGLLLTSANPAAAASVHHIQNLANAQCMNVVGNADFRPATTFRCEDYTNQLWTPLYNSTYNAYQLKVYSTGKCLDAWKTTAAPNGAMQNKCNGSTMQLWRLIDKGNNQRWIQSVPLGECLETWEEDVVVHRTSCAETDTQYWRVWGFNG